jgi:hypothetical protein
MASLDRAKVEICVLMHGGYKLEVIPLETEHLLLHFITCRALRSFGVLVRRNLACLPCMEGGHTCVTDLHVGLGRSELYARLSNVRDPDM